ncbi:MAG: calcium-binding protein, partial [Gammaproteobacteria bacterium]
RIFQPTDKYWLRDGLWLDGIHFGDGTVWTIEDLAAAQAESAKSSGIVFGSGYSDAFTHSQGDGSYFIQELTSNNSNTITFDDVTSDDVTIYQSGDDAIIKLANGEEVQIADQFLKDTQHPIDSLKFSDGTVWSAEDIVARLDPSDLGRHFVGALGDDAYTYTRGDGSISISDSDSGSDTLVFTDTTPDQLVVRRMKYDAVFQLNSGETVVVNDYFANDHANVIERIEFSDGTVWTQDDVRNQMVAQGQAEGFASGTGDADTYVHHVGDGSYAIFDLGMPDVMDRLVFADLNVDDVTLSAMDNDLVMGLSSGETIRLINVLDFGYSLIESVEFADGTTLSAWDLGQKMVADMVATGYVQGSPFRDTFYHTSGDGSYTISDGRPVTTPYVFFDYPGSGDERLIFTDLNETDLSLSRQGNDVILSLSSGEQIRLENQVYHFFDDGSGNDAYGIDAVEFADGTVWDANMLLDKLLYKMAAQGYVEETDGNDYLVHHAGDGSYTISETNSSSDTDINPWGTNGAELY